MPSSNNRKNNINFKSRWKEFVSNSKCKSELEVQKLAIILFKSLIESEKLNNNSNNYEETLLFLEELIKTSVNNNSSRIALEKILEDKESSILICSIKKSSELFINAINNQELQIQDPYSVYRIYANFIKKIIGNDYEELTKMLRKIRFSETHKLSEVLYEIFVEESIMEDAQIFLDALINSLKITEFSHKNVINNDNSNKIEVKTVKLLNDILFKLYNEKCLIETLKGKEEKNLPNNTLQVYTLFTHAFLLFPKYKSDISKEYNKIYLRILYYLGINIYFNSQQNYFLNLQEKAIKENKEIVLLKEFGMNLENCNNYYIDNKKYKENYKDIPKD